MQLHSGQTPDFTSPPQHDCVFKPLSPCGNSQFDAADLQCWQAIVTISVKKTNIDAFYNAFSLVTPPSLYEHVHRDQEKSLEEK